MKIAGVTVLYNPKKDLVENIKTYSQQLDCLYLIDNSYNDNSKLFKKIPNAVYIANHENLGMASALNKAISLSIENGFKWLLTMDQDSYFKKDELEKLINKIINNKDDLVAIFSPLHDTGSKYLHTNLSEKCPVVMTSGNIINVDIANKVSGFKNWLFIDGVDHDFCLNIQKNGYKIKLFSDIKLNHNLGQLKIIKFFWKSLEITNHNHIRRYYITRNRLYLNDLYKNDFPLFCKQELKYTLKENVKILLFETDKLKKLRYSYMGKRDYKKKLKKSPYEIEG